MTRNEMPTPPQILTREQYGDHLREAEDTQRLQEKPDPWQSEHSVHPHRDSQFSEPTLFTPHEWQQEQSRRESVQVQLAKHSPWLK